MREQKFIHYQSIKPNPHNSFDVDNLEDLIASIEMHGILSPLSVIGPYEDGTYMLLSGERRWTSFSKLKEENKLEEDVIPCYIVGDSTMDIVDQKLIIETSNLETRQNFNQNEHRAIVMELLKEKLDNHDITKKEMAEKAAEYFKTSDRYARHWRNVFLNGSDRLKQLVKENKMNIKNAASITSMSEEEQEKVLDDFESGMTTKEVFENHKNRTGESMILEPEDFITEPIEVPETEDDEPNAMSLLEQHVKGKRVNITLEELDNIEFDESMIDGLTTPKDIDSSGLIGQLLNEKEENAREDTSLEIVREWFMKILSTENPSNMEWELIALCKDVANKFYQNKSDEVE